MGFLRMILNSFKFWLLLCLCGVVGCTSTSRNLSSCNQIVLPKEPPSIVLDTGQDKDKYPNTVFVKPPTVNQDKGAACWSFEDIDKINKNLTLWPLWAKDVKELMEGHNKIAGGGGQKSYGLSLFSW